MNQQIMNRFSESVEFHKNGNITAALNGYLSVLRDDSTFRDGYINLGSLYSQLQRYDDAIQCYTRALDLKKDYITFFNIGSLYYKKREYKKAIQYLEKSKQLNAAFVLSLQVMGLCYSQLANYKAAEKNFRDVISIWPKNRVSLTALSILYYNQDRNSEALELLEQLSALDSLKPGVQKLIYSICERTGDMDRSRTEVKKLTRVASGYQLFNQYIESVPVEIYTDKYGTLDEKIERLSAGEQDSSNLISLSLCHLFRGDSDKAIDYLFEARTKAAVNS